MILEEEKREEVNLHSLSLGAQQIWDEAGGKVLWNHLVDV